MVYNADMPVTGKKEVIKEEGQEKDAFSVSFTNGAREQLNELQKHFKTDGELETVKLAISFLQRLKDLDDKKKETESDEQPK